MNFLEKTLSSKKIYDGKIITVTVDEVSLSTGKKAFREVVKHPGAVAVLASTPSGLVMVRQYRYPVGEILWEIPAGKLEKNEQPLATAKRELLEETGYRASKWALLNRFYTSAGFSNEVMYLYYASCLTLGKPQLDEDEILDCHIVHIDELKDLLAKGQICDGKTLVALYWFLARN